jgi:hypothetical protein
VIFSVSCIGMLTYRSFMSYVSSLWCSPVSMLVRSLASVVGFFTLY